MLIAFIKFVVRVNIPIKDLNDRFECGNFDGAFYISFITRATIAKNYFLDFKGKGYLLSLMGC